MKRVACFGYNSYLCSVIWNNYKDTKRITLDGELIVRSDGAINEK